MSEQTDLVRAWIEAYNEREIEQLLSLSTEGIEFRSIFAAIESGGVFRGRAGVNDYFATLDDCYEHFQVVASAYVEGDGGVMVDADAVWRGRGSGATGRTFIFVGCTIDDGRLATVRTFTDEAEARENLRLPQTR